MELPGYVINIADVLAAALLGAAIGAEREWRRHPGSLRSCVLVATAACVFARVAVDFGGNNPGAALGAIATGIGFLGGGVILQRGMQVRGLSTAATFWAVAAIGMAAGVEEYGDALGLTIIVLLAHVVLRPLSAWIEREAPPEDPGPH
jgi:putative Mg2+ transporter-C (MgtC) family protein